MHNALSEVDPVESKRLINIQCVILYATRPASSRLSSTILESKKNRRQPNAISGQNYP